MEFKHVSIMVPEILEALNIKPDGIYADGTAGGGGHSFSGSGGTGFGGGGA